MSTMIQIPLEEEYKKETGVTPEDVAHLREWLQTQPHLPAEHITDLDLVLAYHSCGLSTAFSKQVIELHYTLKTLFHGFFKDRKVDEKVERALNTVLLLPLPDRTKEGYKCFYVSYVDCNPKHFVFEDTVRVLFMIMDLWQYAEGTWPGFSLVIDLQGTVLGHVGCFPLQVMQQYLYFLQEATFVKMKSLHFLNAPSFMDKFMNLMRPFLKQSLQDVLYIHQVGSNSFKDFYSLKSLPKEASGEYKSFKECQNDCMNTLKVNSEFFAREGKKRVEESLRPGKPKMASDFFGVEGSFKKLNVD